MADTKRVARLHKCSDNSIDSLRSGNSTDRLRSDNSTDSLRMLVWLYLVIPPCDQMAWMGESLFLLDPATLTRTGRQALRERN